MVDQPVTYHFGQRLPSCRDMGRCQQANKAEHAGNLRRTLPSSTSTAVLVALFQTLGDMGRGRWHRVLVELQQQRSDPGYQRISAQKRGCLISKRGMGRTAEETRQRRCQRPLKRGRERVGTTQTAQGRASRGLRLCQERHQPGSNRLRSRRLLTARPGEQHLQSGDQGIVCLPERWGFAGTPQSLLQRPLSGAGPKPRRYTEGLDGWHFWHYQNLSKARQCQGLVALYDTSTPCRARASGALTQWARARCNSSRSAPLAHGTPSGLDWLTGDAVAVSQPRYSQR